MDLDINTVRSILTLLLFIGFVTLCLLVIVRERHAYDDAAEIPFKEPDNNE
ncbi:Uncharacterised protein [BD1-7 clade bacterium]|uniref:Cbb3-type cytochrome oxidase component FixQ n=1 Tax=BD1-7 clade bacterium TaxID=2029982 RepID=A0A5S9QRB6_9GAMM|nr:Uncharacterised protein [BD1-7 clade bacterium]CAA0121888.1 Uncharacterised protein [BD1-7 clade bacterium]CAA0124622.1 Uncharacterised protein [BD1-7 clade bacterium]